MKQLAIRSAFLAGTLGLLAGHFSTPAEALTCVWRGTAPFCAGECQPGETEHVRTQHPSEGDSCITGTKVHCCKPDLRKTSDPTAANRTDRPGGDYSNFDLTNLGASFRDCREACALDVRCRAYTFVNAGVQGPHPRCWLKTTVPPTRYSDCCVSGVLPGPEVGTDRPGSDYRNFDLSSPKDGECRRSCARDEICKAYTYVKPGVQGPKARCWLKTSVPPPRPNGCCVSGVLR